MKSFKEKREEAAAKIVAGLRFKVEYDRVEKEKDAYLEELLKKPIEERKKIIKEKKKIDKKIKIGEVKRRDRLTQKLYDVEDFINFDVEKFKDRAFIYIYDRKNIKKHLLADIREIKNKIEDEITLHLINSLEDLQQTRKDRLDYFKQKKEEYKHTNFKSLKDIAYFFVGNISYDKYLYLWNKEQEIKNYNNNLEESGFEIDEAPMLKKEEEFLNRQDVFYKTIMNLWRNNYFVQEKINKVPLYLDNKLTIKFYNLNAIMYIDIILFLYSISIHWMYSIDYLYVLLTYGVCIWISFELKNLFPTDK